MRKPDKMDSVKITAEEAVARLNQQYQWELAVGRVHANPTFWKAAADLITAQQERTYELEAKINAAREVLIYRGFSPRFPEAKIGEELQPMTRDMGDALERARKELTAQAASLAESQAEIAELRAHHLSALVNLSDQNAELARKLAAAEEDVKRLDEVIRENYISAVIIKCENDQRGHIHAISRDSIFIMDRSKFAMEKAMNAAKAATP